MPAAGAGEVAIAELEPNPFQPRLHIDPVRLDELTASVRESGILQPILVRRRGERYQIIAGERRWRAAQAAGLATVPVTVRDVPDERVLELALVENVQRNELTALEEAQAFQRLQDEFKLTQEEIARRVGRERSTIANTLRLLRLPRELRELVSQGRLDAGHGARAARPRQAGGPARARPRGRAQGAVGPRGRAAGGAAARAAQGGRGVAQGREHARRRGAAARRARRARRDRAPRPRRPDPGALRDRGRAQPALRAARARRAGAAERQRRERHPPRRRRRPC